MSFMDELQKQTNKTRTENGAVTNKSTLNPCLDFFSMAGAMRSNPKDAITLFDRAYAQDRLIAIRTLFYLRDVRGGQGERVLFRTLLKHLQAFDPTVYEKIVTYVPEYGRWDDLFAAGLNLSVVDLIKQQLEADEFAMEAKTNVSLLAKWLPSENTSSKATKALAVQMAKALGLKPSKYRRKVVALRKYIKLLEEQMSANEWSDIEYSKLPSQAHRKHTKAFKRHDSDRYGQFLSKAVKGEVKLNTATVYAYEVFDMVRAGQTDAANAVWAQLPDYTDGKNAIVLADVSGSMTSRVSGNTTAMSVSVSLALYFAEHNKGPFQGKFMTFSDNPQVVDVLGSTLEQRLHNIENRQWGMSTNLEAALMAILNAGVASGAKGDDMPKVLYVISDMEFNQAISRPDASIFDNARGAYQAAGLPMPHIVFWNVMARQVQAPATKLDSNVTLLSGLSQSTFRYAVEGKTPEELMLAVVNGPRYATIEL